MSPAKETLITILSKVLLNDNTYPVHPNHKDVVPLIIIKRHTFNALQDGSIGSNVLYLL